MSDMAPPTDQAALRDRIAESLYTLMLRNGWDGERTEPVVREMGLVLDAVLAVLSEPTAQDDLGSGRQAEAELYVLLRKAGEGRYEAQTLIDRHRDEVLRRAELRRMAEQAQPAPTIGLTPDSFARLLVGANVLSGRAARPFDELTEAEQNEYRRQAQQLLAGIKPGVRQDGARP